MLQVLKSNNDILQEQINQYASEQHDNESLHKDNIYLKEKLADYVNLKKRYEELQLDHSKSLTLYKDYKACF